MPAWAYKFVWVTGRATGQTEKERRDWVEGALAHSLEQLGNDQWEVFSVFQGMVSPMNQGWYILAKRPK
jgi:hypothetical protein